MPSPLLLSSVHSPYPLFLPLFPLWLSLFFPLLPSCIQSLGDGGQGWGNIFLYVIFSPKIRERLFYCIRHPNLRYLLGLNFSSSSTSFFVHSSVNCGLQGRRKDNQNSGVSINNDDTTNSFTPTVERTTVDIASPINEL